MNEKQKNSTQSIEKRRQDLIAASIVTLVTLAILGVYLMPLAFGIVTSLKTSAQASEPNAPLMPMDILTVEYEGDTLEIFAVPFDDGERQLAILKPGRAVSTLIDPTNPDPEPIEWEGNWRQLEPVREVAVQWGNYPEAWETIDFVQLLFNTLVYAFVTMTGTVIASSMVAYGFARFRFPGKNILFMILLATIILPPAVTLVPTYAFFINVLGWGGTWLPLIVPQMFGNAYNVFLLRQYFLTIPREMEEAASIDGAGPITTFIR